MQGTLRQVKLYFDNKQVAYRLTPPALALLQQFEEQAARFREACRIANRFKDGDYLTDDFSEHVEFLSDHIHRPLKDHQVKASYHLSLLGNGANFSVPGSGKTSVVLAHYEKMKVQGKVNVLYVVGPTSCFKPWKDEFQLVLDRTLNCITLAGGDPELRRAKYYVGAKHAELYLTTFPTLMNDKDFIPNLFCDRAINVYFVVDEAHYLKRIDGQWANSVLSVSKYAKFRCALTGTPIPRNYSDLYNIFDFLWPEQKVMSVQDRRHITELEGQGKFADAKSILDREYGPLWYRVRKLELGLKPQVFHDPTEIEMNVVERKIYDTIIGRVKTLVFEDDIRDIDVLYRLRRGRMIRMRQCLSYASLLSNAIRGYDGEEDLIGDDSDLRRLIAEYDNMEKPAKITELLKKIGELHRLKRKVVIWAHFIGTVNFIIKELRESGYACKKIIGEIPVESAGLEGEETREKIISEFLDVSSGLNILVANPAACAESISLHKTCHDAVYYDLSYNAAQYLQSLDRIHRVGGSEDVEANYHYLQYANTIDNKILINLSVKAKKMYDVIDDDYEIYSLDMEDEVGNEDDEIFRILFG
jgi:SNF2 family DNA or RNA helicase